MTSLPDNTVQTLSYVDPKTGQNTTCTLCPLSTDPSILYQDFLFEFPVSLTGVQIILSEWAGTAPGLHILQLLSSGAFASAISNDNVQSCFSPNPSNVSMTGTWVTKNANTLIPATMQAVLLSTFPIGTPANEAPTFTWMPYVSAAGEYDINFVIPGCAPLQDCASRTSVQLTVFPGVGSQPFVTVVSQQNQDDVAILLYRGPVVPTSSNFVMTVTMTLANNPVGTGQGEQYELVAGNIELVLTSANMTDSFGPSGTNSGNSTGVLHGFGFFKWPLDSSITFDATGVIPASQVSLDSVGLSLYNALSAASFGSTAVSAIVSDASSTIFLAGSFNLTAGPANGAANIVGYKSGALLVMASNGLNGIVSSVVLYGDQLFVGGSFTDTQRPSMNGKLRGIAVYDITSDSWTALGAGVDGPVAGLTLYNNQLQVVGNFTQVFSTSSIGSNAGGFAIWDIKSSSWFNTGGFVLGNMTLVANGTSSQPQFVAGRVQRIAEYGSPGFVMLSNGDNGPVVTPLEVELGTMNSVSSPPTVNRRRGHGLRGPVSWISHHLRSTIFSRQLPTLPAALPPLPVTPAPAVLTGTFWYNASSSHEVAIIGGNFTFSTPSVAVSRGLAIYDPSSPSISALVGPQIFGVVRALLVDSDRLYVGGEFNLSAVNANGFATYDLIAQQWVTLVAPPLQPTSGSSVVIRSITTSASKPSSVILGGTFDRAGTVACQAICILDISLGQWSALGNGIQGDVLSVSYAGVGSQVQPFIFC